MKLSSVKNFVIFKGMSDEEIQSALEVLRYDKKSYEKGETILHAGSTTRKMGIVLSGSVTVESIDLLGNKTILSHISVGDFFAETYAFLGNESMAVDVCANENCKIFFLNIGNKPNKRTAITPVPSARMPMLFFRKNATAITAIKTRREAISRLIQYPPSANKNLLQIKARGITRLCRSRPGS